MVKITKLSVFGLQRNPAESNLKVRQNNNAKGSQKGRIKPY